MAIMLIAQPCGADLVSKSNSSGAQPSTGAVCNILSQIIGKIRFCTTRLSSYIPYDCCSCSVYLFYTYIIKLQLKLNLVFKPIVFKPIKKTFEITAIITNNQEFAPPRLSNFTS